MSGDKGSRGATLTIAPSYNDQEGIFTTEHMEHAEKEAGTLTSPCPTW